jgi:UDP-glucuronate 4-epimerase
MGIDNHNNYYNQDLKEARLRRHSGHQNYTHIRADIADSETILNLFKIYQPQRVVNLAAQPGVRYSLENPKAYIESNLVGFSNVLDCCRQNKVDHLVYASSSSVYGANTELPFSVHQNVDHPLNLYAATKKANELMAHSYSHLYNLPTTGLRFFTVYGPFDRPDMALQKFATAIVNGETLKVFNDGKHQRDFTYIDDIVEGVIRVLDKPAYPNPNWDSKKPDPATSKAPWRIYNIGNNSPVGLMEYIEALELALGKKAKKEFLPIQAGDLPSTWADVDDLITEFGYLPNTKIKDGVIEFAKWFKTYY